MTTHALLRGQSLPLGPWLVRVVRVEGQHVTVEATGPGEGAGVREAAERRRAWRDWAKSDDELAQDPYADRNRNRLEDAALLADAYLALASPPPAGGEGDDGTVFRELVEAVGRVFGRRMCDDAKVMDQLKAAHDRAADAVRRRGGESRS